MLDSAHLSAMITLQTHEWSVTLKRSAVKQVIAMTQCSTTLVNALICQLRHLIVAFHNSMALLHECLLGMAVTTH